MNEHIPDQRQWRCPNGRKFVLREWGNEVVLYDTAAGDTHLITFNASQILQQILEQPSTLSELAANTIAADAESADDLLVELVSVVNALHKLGLIEPGAS